MQVVNGLLIEDGVLKKCYSSVTDAVIPDWVESIGSSAFYFCHNLKSVTIPSSVKTIESSAFANCKNLTSVMMTKGLLSIGSSAFKSCENLQTIKLPNSVRQIGINAFAHCKNLTSINIPNRVTIIPSGLFYCCLSLPTISLHKGITEIGSGAFYACIRLKKIHIPDSITHICSEAFEKCESLQRITIPDSVESIASRAFLGCKGLADRDGFVIVGGVLFDYLGSAANITIPDSVVAISSKAFENNRDLVSVSIPASVRCIGWEAFQGCINLQNITIPNSVESIEPRAFWRCEGLADRDGFVIAGGVLFDYFGSAANITIPDSVVAISSRAFLANRDLVSISMSNGVSCIHRDTFERCRHKLTIHAPKGSYAETYAKENNISFCEAGTISCEENAACLDESLMEKKDIRVVSLEQFYELIKKPVVDSEHTIGIIISTYPVELGPFYDCPFRCGIFNFDDIDYVLEHIFTLDDAKKIVRFFKSYEQEASTIYCVCDGRGNRKSSAVAAALYRYYGRDEEEIKNIWQNPMFEPSPTVYRALTSVLSVPVTDKDIIFGTAEEQAVPPTTINDFVIKDGVLSKYTGKNRTVVIPEGVTRIASDAFKDHTEITSITVPSTVTKIVFRAFENCKKLTNIVLPECTTNIYPSAFRGCNGLADKDGFVIIRGVLYAYCGNDSQVTIPDCVTSIDRFVFRNNKILTCITIPNGITQINSYVFSGCENLTNVTIPESVVRIEACAFENCINLSSITIPNSIKYISFDAFEGCDNITIYAQPGSYIERYAKKMDMPFVAI